MPFLPLRFVGRQSTRRPELLSNPSEVIGPMWFLLVLLFVMWVLSVHFYLPAWLSIALIGGIVSVLVLMMLPSRSRSADYMWRSPY